MNRDVLVIAELFRERLTEATFELLGKGKELSQALGGKLFVALLGHQVSGFVGELGAADVVCVADALELREFTPEAYATVLEAAIKDLSPCIVLLGSTSDGLDLLSLLSARAGHPCLDSCVRLEVQSGAVRITSQIYGGKLFAEVKLPEETTLVAVVPGMFPADSGKADGKPEIRPLGVSSALPVARTIFRRWIEPPPGDVDITKAPILVAVGRGIQNAHNISLAEELAEALGGVVCASRPVIDMGWLPLTRQVGKSGMTVKPKAYLAFGISGAPEHLEGMKQSELIVAVNTDSKAPIFGTAHFGAAADALELLPLLTEEVRKLTLKKVG